MGDSGIYRLAGWFAKIGIGVVLLLCVMALASLVSLTGCVHVRYSDGEFGYTRLGSQEIEGLTVTHGETTVALDSQKSDAAETISATTELIRSVRP